MRFTVFTPTYNRATLLWDLYHSLCRQSFFFFLWIIIDDGSTDNTVAVVQEMQSLNPFFPIIYKKVPNGGKHRAWNLGVDMASGELFFGCDSDDYLTDDALEIADKIEKTIPLNERDLYAGICGLRGDKSSQIIGKTFDGEDIRDMTYLERSQNNAIGDKSEVFYSAVWKKYKYQEFEGENFITEATSLYRMALDGLNIRFFNSIIKICEYRPDGLTANSREKFAANPKGWGLYISQRIRFRQLSGLGKWDVLTDYYERCRDRLSILQMARNLHQNVASYYLGVQLTKIRYRLNRLKQSVLGG